MTSAVFFDLDGTLLDGSSFPESIVRTCEAVAVRNPALKAADLIAANNEIWPKFWSEIGYEWSLGTLDESDVTLEAWRRTLSACDCEDESLMAFAKEAHDRFGREAHRFFDDVVEVVEALLEARIPLALITNGAPQTQRDKVRALGIEGWFEALIISGEVGKTKPDASLFRMALEQLNVPAEDVWHVGDSLANDVAGAQAAGVKAAWINRDGYTIESGDPVPDIEVRSLGDLLALLER